jgi:sortase (surface protein transpeptidase)
VENRPRFRGRGGILLLVLAAFALVLIGDASYGMVLESGGAHSGDTTPASTLSISAGVPVNTTATTSPPTTTTSPPPAIKQFSAPSITTTTIYTHAIADPVRIRIPAIEADAEIVKVGVAGDGSMEVPDFGLAAWFSVGPAPGAPGPAVIVGHVDSKKGPDVFYDLKDLQPGDEIHIYDRSGDVATFVVDSSEKVPKTELPTERIWLDTPEPVIRLVTCGGEFNRRTGHYLSNIIIYGHLVD